MLVSGDTTVPLSLYLPNFVLHLSSFAKLRSFKIATHRFLSQSFLISLLYSIYFAPN